MNLPKNDQRRVLLIDSDSARQRLRAIALRYCEVEVHTASDVSDAARLWTRCSYDLVLLAAEENSEQAVLLCDEAKKRKLRQRVALLVGAPQYVQEMGGKRTDSQTARIALAPRLLTGAPPAQPTQWRIMMERVLAAG
jgi:DNA-binding NtrC family response regulator